MKYEYAGFWYDITQQDGRWIAEACPGQHPAASKEKHRRAVVEVYLEESEGGTEIIPGSKT